MANILDRYGIKEVADVTFYQLDNTGNPTVPVLYLDTLKVSTIEQTAEQAEARGGKGNPPLIIWDYGKEINVTLEDALFSAKSMAIMFGNGKVKPYTGSQAFIMKTEQFVATGEAIPGGTKDESGWKLQYEAPDGKLYNKLNPKFFDADSNPVVTKLIVGERYFCSFDLLANGSVIEVSANTFPGTYYVIGDTFARSEASGIDEFFQFIIPKAKVQSENTITLEAEGDPSVFNMSLRVMRPTDGKMMKLVKYDLVAGVNPDEKISAEMVHNHVLNPDNMDTLDDIVTSSAVNYAESGVTVQNMGNTYVVSGDAVVTGFVEGGDYKANYADTGKITGEAVGKLTSVVLEGVVPTDEDTVTIEQVNPALKYFVGMPGEDYTTQTPTGDYVKTRTYTKAEINGDSNFYVPLIEGGHATVTITAGGKIEKYLVVSSWTAAPVKEEVANG